MLEVRPARLDEIGACADLYVRVLADTFTWMDPARHRRGDFIDAARQEEVYVAAAAGRLVGVAALYRPQRFLHSLYAAERGRGVGSALLDYARAMAGGPLSLKVQAANLAARAFYARRGYREVEAGRDGDIRWIRMAGP